MGRHNHAAGCLIGSYRDLGAIVEAAHHLTFGTLLELIGGQVQPRLKQRMIEQVIVFAARHKRERGHIGEHGPIAILPVEPQQRAFLRKMVGRQIPTNGHKPLAQFLPIPPVPAIAKRAQPLMTVRLRNRCPRPDNLSAFASPVARRTDLIQSAKGRRKLISLG